ncbi:hypothetical protein ACQ1Q1_01725 [Ornithobacterium rhinotracheale]|nr:hypothetical protein [Ornithobacterium rhinotracheale]MBN3663091.1 hypothetical protein [Ornithobacterium rhinotracheale]MCK0194947.1 hypothetical protein [Ornithobacterium rhinotracheale]MCK0202426.1 hypothetical protein [Ornithobacterium rhinotracheale]UOH64207.1 hypothetical protein MT993_03065 [Ornithobacterium rhinotracheale]UOH65768.1 hypothetical protein MT999_11335 [Ornithobacterium rhinotracheale]
MKKTLLLMSLLPLAVFAQEKGRVGINEGDPKATLEISVSKENESTKTKEGILIPRVSRQRAADMGSDVTESTLIYVDDISNGSLTGTTFLVNEKGFYFFKDKVWRKIEGTSTFTRNVRTASELTVTVLPTDYFIYIERATKVNFPTPNEANKGQTVCLYSPDTSPDLADHAHFIGQYQTLQEGITSCYISTGKKWLNSSGF